MTIYTFHPYANIFPLMSDSEFEALVEDVATHGQKQPIVLMDEHILDGRNRYNACIALGIAPKTLMYEGHDPLGDVISWNLQRRHLSESQRALVAAKIANITRGGSRQSANLHIQISRASASKLLNVSPRLISTAKKIQILAAPEMLAYVHGGQITVNAASYLTLLPIEEQQKIVALGLDAVKKAAIEIRTSLREHRTLNEQHNEWYTPTEYVECARTFFGTIDMDPASCEQANQTVQATHFFTRKEDGLQQRWHGKIWLNPPYSQPTLNHFIDKAIAEYQAGHVSEIIVLVHSFTDARWFHTVLKVANAVLFTKTRIRFINPQGLRASCTQGQVLIYFGNRSREFSLAFKAFGTTLFTEHNA